MFLFFSTENNNLNSDNFVFDDLNKPICKSCFYDFIKFKNIKK